MATRKNSKRKQLQAEKRQARLIARTQSLMAKRTKDHTKPLVGTVLEIVDKDHNSYPHEARRHVGRYLRVRTAVGDLLSRHRTKITKD